MLGRARALRKQGASVDDLLDAVSRGLALASPRDPAIGELVALRLDLLITNGRNAEALAAAEAYLASGETARRAEISVLAEELRGR